MLAIDKWGSGNIICSQAEKTGQHALTEVNAIKITISCCWPEGREARGNQGNENKEGGSAAPLTWHWQIALYLFK